MNLMMLLLLLISALAAVIGNFMLLVAAFRQSFLWGLATLFLPFVQLFFLIRHWEESKKGFYLGMGGALLFMGTIFCLPNRGECLEAGWKNAFARSGYASASNQSKIKELTSQIQEKRDDISQMEGEFSQTTASLASQYKEITAKRQALNTDDPAAVNQFNTDAAAYHQLNNRVKQMTQNLNAARQELDDLLDERSKLQAVAKTAASPSAPAESAPAAPHAPNAARPVVIYTTSHGGYCVKAKQYLAQKGVAYQEINVENSSTAQAEFKRLGGNGVPLILVGDRRIEGFDQAALDQALQ